MAESKKKRPSRKKPPVDLTDDQAMRRLFPKAVRDQVKRDAEKSDKKGKRGDHDDQL